MNNKRIVFTLIAVIALLSVACGFSSLTANPTPSVWERVDEFDGTNPSDQDSSRDEIEDFEINDPSDQDSLWDSSEDGYESDYSNIDAGYTLVMYDDFSDNSNGWVEGESDTYAAAYAPPDHYRMYVNGVGHLLWSINPKDTPMQDVLVSTVAKNNGGSEDNMFGVICRVTSEDAFYGFVISTDGHYTMLQRHSDGSVSRMLDELWYASSLLENRDSVKISAECLGDTLTLLVDDVPLVSVTVPQESVIAGGVGLLIGAMVDEGSDILFDEFSVHVK